jgi:alkylmercury lyase
MSLGGDDQAAVVRGAWIGSAARQAALPALLRELHRAVLRRFLQTGDPPATRWIADAVARLGLSGSAVAELEAAHLVHAANGVVSVAYPFSGPPTRALRPPVTDPRTRR